ncbi:MAG TPA: ATPase, T2SS/T4P/T4SS family [Candidatus Polarisedimenticolia bacterium]|jgi:type IV pilus assembly protein PilB|nr:ATPase, T2SS/T4P/T4SS family [Candidatus Polarisedimenticolia bacterium]
MKEPRVNECILNSGLLDADGLARVLEIKARDGGSLARIAANLGLAEEESVSRAIATGLGLEYKDLTEASSQPPSEVTLPAEFCVKRLVVPLGLKDGTLQVAMADPLDHSTIQDVEFRTSKWVAVVMATESAILRVLKASSLQPVESTAMSYDMLASVNPDGEVEVSQEDQCEVIDPTQLAKDVKLPPIVRLVNVALTNAAKAGASDIHIEPHEHGLLIRHRIDGILQDVLQIPKHLQQPVISRIKIISGMDIAERRKPQDGRSRLRVDKRRIDLRVSSLPTSHGEKIVVRFLDSANASVSMDGIGFAPDLRRRFEEMLTRPQGMILVTGPTGSGKTTTLYAALNRVKSHAKNIITVEDPIEYQLAGISQVQINPKAGVTFASGLRSILRQDPDIVLLGEIRDRETAQIALEAAQTGHLLLSTMHTNDAPSSITRLLDLGIEPFMIAASLIGILAQRLVRKPCPDCIIARAPSPEILEKFTVTRPDPSYKAGQGCPNCGQTGFRGRTAIHEFLVINDELRDRIARGAAEHETRAAARRAGMRTLMEDGVMKAGDGLTTLEEVLRVIPPDEVKATTTSQAAPRTGPAIDDSSTTLPEGEKVRVLVVEDSPTVVTVVKYFLENEGFEVLVAANGVEGLRIARDSAPHVVVSDLNMPEMDGIALVQELRADARTRGAGIILLTSDDSVETEARGLATGADDYLAKPVEPKRLAARIKTILARNRTRQAEKV